MDVEFQEAWNTIRRRGDNIAMNTAATTLVTLRDQLQGAAFVRIPDHNLHNPFWQAVVEGSVAMCACGLRRLILPTRGRALPLLTEERYVVDADHQLVIAPWGGDLASTYVSFRIKGGSLIGKHGPFHPVQPQYRHESWVLRCTDPLRPNETSFTLFELADIVRTRGGSVCMQPLGDLTVPICMVEAVSLDDGNVTFRLDHTVTAVGSADLTLAPHSCS